MAFIDSRNNLKSVLCNRFWAYESISTCTNRNNILAYPWAPLMLPQIHQTSSATQSVCSGSWFESFAEDTVVPMGRCNQYRAGLRSGQLTRSLASGLWLCVIVYSNGFKKSFWNLKLASSSFSRKRIASCRSASNAKNDTVGLVWQQTLLKCSPRIFHILDHSKRMRFML